MKFKLERKHIPAVVISLMWLCFQLYLALVTPLHPLLQNPIHLMFALALVFIYNPIGKGLWRLVDVAIGGGIVFTAYYFITQTERLQTRIPYVDTASSLDITVMLITVLILLEAVRRILGVNLLVFILIFIGYAAWGSYFPGWLKFDGIKIPQFTELMVMGPDGILGIPLATSTDYLFYFILFGAFFSEFGGGKVLIDMGLKLSDKQAGGPAKAAIISSGLLGMVSGSAVANVSTTGVMTIPMMKKVGYKPEQAGAVEAIASTGGQIMPPIMGVGAFIMAEMLGVKYGYIAMSAVLPALAYYFSIFMLVDLIARRNRYSGLQQQIKFESDAVLPRLYLLIPALIVVYYILSGASLMRAALIGTVAVLAVNLFNRKARVKLPEILDCILQGTKQASSIAIPTAACGIIIGIAIQSGLATKLSAVMISLGGSNLLAALILATIGCMVLGMALPTVAAYLVAAVLFVPTLTKLGIGSLPANMFVFYFGIIAQITPPVCLASFTAAGIAGANPMKTGWTAFRYALVAFFVPFVFVYKPEILLLGTPFQIVTAAAGLAIGTLFLAVGMAGYLFVPIEKLWQRILIVLFAILIITPENITSIIGFIGVGVISAMYFLKKKKATQENKILA